MAEPPEELTEEDKAKALENKIKAPLVWGFYEKKKLRVEDLQDKRYKDAIIFLKKHFINNEITFTMLNTAEDHESVQEFLDNAKIQMKDKASIVAVKEETGEIVGVMIMRIVDKASFSRTFSKLKIRTGNCFSTIMKYYNTLEGSISIHDMYNAPQYIKIYTVGIKPKYQDKGLIKFMYKCAMKSARAYKIYVIAGIFTTGLAQEVATELGFIQLNNVFFQKYLINGVMVFQNPGSGNYGAAFKAIRISEEEPEEDD